MHTADRILTALLLAPMSQSHLAIVLGCHCSLTEQLVPRLCRMGYIYPKGTESLRLRTRSGRSWALTPKGVKVAQNLIKSVPIKPTNSTD